MAFSMTGFGRGEVKKDDKEITIEIKTLNNRYLDISVKTPKNFFFYEEEIKNIVRKYIGRGRKLPNLRVKMLIT